jgi:hypothetical protein
MYALVMKKLALVISVSLLMTLGLGSSTAWADPVELDNGYIDTNIFKSFIHDSDDGASIFLYKTPFDVGSKIAVTNWSGLGITLTFDDKCYTSDTFDACGGTHNSDATINTAREDYSGILTFTNDTNTYYYGTVVTTKEVILGGKSFQVINSIKLNQAETFLTVETQIKNLNGSDTSVNLFINNFDGMIRSDSAYRMTRGNIVNGAFVALNNDSESSNAVIADANEETFGGSNTEGAGYGAILYTNESGTSSVVFRDCCSPNRLAGLPGTGSADLTLSNTDGSYAIGKQLTLASNQTYSFKWAFGAGTYSSGLDSSLVSGIVNSLGVVPALKKASTEVVRNSTNLSFSQSLYGSDTLSDPDGKLRALIDQIFAKYGK